MQIDQALNNEHLKYKYGNYDWYQFFVNEQWYRRLVDNSGSDNSNVDEKSNVYTSEYLNNLREKLFPNIKVGECVNDGVNGSSCLVKETGSEGGIENYPVYMETLLAGNVGETDVENWKEVTGKYVR